MGAARKRIKCQANGKGIRIVVIPQIGTAYGAFPVKRFTRSLSRYLTIGQERCMFMRSILQGNPGKINRVCRVDGGLRQ